MTLIGSVGKRGKAFLFQTGYYTSCDWVERHIHRHTQARQLLKPWFSVSLRGESVREESGTHRPGAGLGGVTVKAVFLPTVCFELWWFWNGPGVVW